MEWTSRLRTILSSEPAPSADSLAQNERGQDSDWKALGFFGVNVWTASNGTGCTLEFHLDSIAGMLIGTATLPIT
jgi:hypothetical protein